MYRILLYIFISLLAITGCRKEKPQGSTVLETPDSTRIMLINRTGKQLHCYLYKTQDDYKFSRNPLFTAVINRDDSLPVFFTKDYTVYYLDWFSNDKQVTNWGAIRHTGIFNGVPFDFVMELKGLSSGFVEIVGTQFFNQRVRNVFMGWNEPETRWKAVDIIDNSGSSRWSTVPEYQKHVELTLAKDMQIIYRERDALDNERIEETTFNVNSGSSDNCTAFFSIEAGTLSSRFLTNKMPSTGQEAPNTLYMNAPQTGGYFYVMKKQ